MDVKLCPGERKTMAEYQKLRGYLALFKILLIISNEDVNP
jgi:hypothetical protein